MTDMSPEAPQPGEDGAPLPATVPELAAALSAQGFADPESWIGYARAHVFRRVPSSPVTACPGCGATASKVVGRYVFYSTHMELLACSSCALVYRSRQLADAVIEAHFRRAYVDDAYFRHARRDIFAQIARLVDRVAPLRARVLDVGGALGHLMAIVRRRRPDLRITIADVNPDACRIAAAKGFASVNLPFGRLDPAQGRFNVVVMSDVIYYERDVGRLWTALRDLVVPGGQVIIRVPNKSRSQNRLCWKQMSAQARCTSAR